MASAPIIPFGVRDAQGYLSGQRAARDYALAHGFVEESMVELLVLWGEQDPNAHVNNSVFFRYLEAGRIAFIRSFTANLSSATSSTILSGKGKGIILGEVTNKYLRPLVAPDHVLVAHKLVKLGDRKIHLESMIYSYAQQAQVGAGKATLVTYDYDSLNSISIPDEMRKSLESRLPPIIASKL